MYPESSTSLTACTPPTGGCGSVGTLAPAPKVTDFCGWTVVIAVVDWDSGATEAVERLVTTTTPSDDGILVVGKVRFLFPFGMC